MLVKVGRRKLESQSASQTCELLSDSDLTHCGVRDMYNMSSNHSGKDTHGLMTVHLACSSRKNSSDKTDTGSTQRNSHPRCNGRHGTPVLCYDPVPGLPTSGTEGPSYGWRTTRREEAGMLTEAIACHRTAESRAGRRSSGQLTVRDVDPTHVSFFTTWWYSRYCIWTLEKVLNTPHTPSSQVNSAITLGCANSLVASVICYWVHSHLGTLLTSCCIKNSHQRHQGNSQSNPTPANLSPTWKFPRSPYAIRSVATLTLL